MYVRERKRERVRESKREVPPSVQRQVVFITVDPTLTLQSTFWLTKVKAEL